MGTEGLNDARIADWIHRVETERERSARPRDFPELPEISAARYNDSAHFALERAHFWSRMWLYAAHIDQLAEPGSYLVWNHGSAPILIIRGDDDKIRAKNKDPGSQCKSDIETARLLNEIAGDKHANNPRNRTGRVRYA